ncbi:MAG: hypothetical protein V1743_02430, partial [Nanoarchaeota archaeon]
MHSIKKYTLEQAEQIIRELEHKFTFTLFLTYEWLAILSKNISKPEIYIFYRNDNIIGFLPVFPKKLFTTIRFSPLLGAETAYGGIVCDEEIENNLAGLYDILKREK